MVIATYFLKLELPKIDVVFIGYKCFVLISIAFRAARTPLTNLPYMLLNKCPFY